MNAERALHETIASVEIGDPVSRENLWVFPLIGGGSNGGGVERHFLLLDEAISAGMIRIEELGEAGSVPELRVTNKRDAPVLILEGDELVGAKQNRTANSSVLVAAACEMVLPVSCVERGRWSSGHEAFARGRGSPHLTLRRMNSRTINQSLRSGRGHRTDQNAVWDEVSRVARVHGALSQTEALADTRQQLSERLCAFNGLANELPAETRGVIVAIGSRCVLAEMLADPTSFAKAFPNLLSGYALEALEFPSVGLAPERSEAIRLLCNFSSAEAEERTAVGAGTDLRLSSRALHGYALFDGESLLHAAAFVAKESSPKC